jgi:signal transduction histidine kinase
MPWHDISDGGVLALVHQEDGRHLHSAPHRSPDWASERWWLREDGFEFPGARQLGNRPIRPRAAPTSKVRKTLDTTGRGQLTGGIAHDFNNLLLVISGNLELLEPHIRTDDPRALLKEAQDAAALGSKLTDQLLTFARRRHMDAHVIQLNDLVVNIADMLRRALGEHITLSTSLARDAWSTRADPGQFQSAIVNMAVNARDAMPQGGKLVIETRNIVLDADHTDYQSELQPGAYVQLSISDTGTGMDPAVRDRVFEPFFTTKEKGRGTGLGLAMVYGFVKQLCGHVTIYSEPGHGTTINLYFPRSDALAPDTYSAKMPAIRQAHRAKPFSLSRMTAACAS